MYIFMISPHFCVADLARPSGVPSRDIPRVCEMLHHHIAVNTVPYKSPHLIRLIGLFVCRPWLSFAYRENERSRIISGDDLEKGVASSSVVRQNGESERAVRDAWGKSDDKAVASDRVNPRAGRPEEAQFLVVEKQQKAFASTPSKDVGFGKYALRGPR